MAAYMIVLTSIRTPDWISDYSAAVPPILAKFGGEYVAIGQQVDLFEAPMELPDGVVVFRFPSRDAIRAFLTSEEYRPWAEKRHAGSTSSILAFESVI